MCLPCQTFRQLPSPISGMILCIHIALEKLIPVIFWETTKCDCKGKNRWANHIPIHENRIFSISAEGGRKHIWPRGPQWSLCWWYLTIKEHLQWEKHTRAVCKHLHTLTKHFCIPFRLPGWQHPVLVTHLPCLPGIMARDLCVHPSSHHCVRPLLHQRELYLTWLQ